jgi:hypothetical protein
MWRTKAERNDTDELSRATPNCKIWLISPEADALQARYETVLPPQAHDQQAERTPVVAPGVVCVRNVQGATLNPRNARVLCGPPAAKNGTGAYHDLSGITPNALSQLCLEMPAKGE